MPTVPYVKQTWTDGVSSASGARLAVIEEGIHEVSFAPAVRVFHNANQAITTSTVTVLSFNSERFDQAGNVASTMHDTVTNNSRLICRHAGVYMIGCNIEFESVAAGTFRQVAIRHSVGPTLIADNVRAGTFGAVMRMHISTLYALAVNEYVEVIVQHDRGSNLNVTAIGNSSPEFWMVRVG